MLKILVATNIKNNIVIDGKHPYLNKAYACKQQSIHDSEGKSKEIEIKRSERTMERTSTARAWRIIL